MWRYKLSEVCDNQNKNERSNSRRADIIDTIIYIYIYTRDISRYIEGEHVGRLGKRITRI